METANILVVEDESIIALDIRNSLIKSGYHVTAIAASSTEALAKIEETRPDLVLMDIQIRGEMDGVATAEQVRDRFHIPVIYLTAHADETTLQRAKVTAPFGYVLKPFEDRELVTTIEIALSRHQAEMAIYQALEREKELTELKARFVSVVSHEFRNPLSTIVFSTELLERHGQQLTDEKKQIYLQRIQVSVKRMNQLLTDVLTIGEAEAGKLQFKPTAIDLEKFCQDMVEEFQVNAGEKHQVTFRSEWLANSGPNVLNHSSSVAIQAPPVTTTVYLDEKLVQHILTNLLSNAIKYSPQGGHVSLDVSCKQEEVTFRIQDDGIGIPVADQTQLFDSFHRGSNVKTIPGTGLGLSIVKQCVDVHSGSISVASDVGMGTIFTVTLPLTQWQTDEKDSSD